MRVAVVGAGAIGGLVGAKLSLAGADVTCIARGASLAAIRAGGLRLLLPDGSEQVAANVRATDDCAAAGAQDVVVIAVKAHQLPDVAPRLAPLLGPHTCVVPMQNGVPYWYFHRHGGPLEGTVLRSVDPGASLARWLPPERVIGCVVYPASELARPGVIRHVEGDRLPLGEPDASRSDRALQVAGLFTRAGFKAPVLDDIRAEIWLKLWGNLTFNPISALGHATLQDICRFPPARALAASMMREAGDVAGRLGIRFRVTLEQRIAGAEKVGRHKTSMLQDVEAGRAPEIDALLGSVLELGRLTHTATPHLAAVHALVQLLAHSMDQAQGRVRLEAIAA